MTMDVWFVLNTKPKKEFQVEKIFTEAGFVIYNPKYRSDDRVLPFFPGYEFIQFKYPEQYQTVRYTRGVKRVVGDRQGPTAISRDLIDEIRSREVDGFVELEKYGPLPELGDEIEVAEGPMKGLQGVFQKQLKPSDRILILLNYVSYQGQMIIDKQKIKKLIK